MVIHEYNIMMIIKINFLLQQLWHLCSLFSRKNLYFIFNKPINTFEKKIKSEINIFYRKNKTII